MKICTKCKEDKQITDFGKAKLGKDGLRSICKKCHNAATTERNAKNPEKVAAYGVRYRQEKREQISAQRAVHTANNKEKLSNYQYKYNRDNAGKVNAKTAKYKAAKIQATPKWVTKIHLGEIENFYIEAARLTKETGIPHEVDHIIPLRGEQVRGLHVPWNLRVIPRSENRKKSYKVISILL